MRRALEWLVVAAPLAFAIAACSDPDPTTPHDGPGCPYTAPATRGEPEMQLVARGVDGVAVPIHDGDTVPLVFPPQGGRVVFVGVRAKNMTPCGATLSGALRDPTTHQVRIDGRTINLVPGDDGWSGSVDADIASFTNIPACPNQWASTDVYDHPFELTITLKDTDGRLVSETIHVTPTCSEPGLEAECRCICQKDYVLGQVCDPDAGSGGAGGASKGAGGAGGSL